MPRLLCINKKYVNALTILPVQEPAKSSKDLSPPIDLQLPSGNLIVRYGKWMKMHENGIFIDELPPKNGDFP